MSEKKTEACGRCSMSTVVDAAVEEEHDPFGEERIEVDEEEFSRVSPAVWLNRISGRIDAAVQRFIYGR
ncbi:MAG: hypothetical protein PPP58_03790 [Natronomonas sp.]